MSRKDFHKVVIGRAELLHFMDVAIADVPAKVDTGAYRSAVHADQVSVTKNKLGVNELSFRVLGGHSVCGDLATVITTTEFNKVRVANSFGHEEDRYEVKLRVKLGPKVFLTAFTLADRSKKIYPILLGRKLLNDRFLVDTSESSVNRIELKKQYGIVFPVDEEDGRNT